MVFVVFDELAHQSQAPVILSCLGVVVLYGTLFKHEDYTVYPEVIEGRIAALTPLWRSLGDIYVQIPHEHVEVDYILVPFYHGSSDILTVEEAEPVFAWILLMSHLALRRSVIEVAYSLLIILVTVYQGHGVEEISLTKTSQILCCSKVHNLIVKEATFSLDIFARNLDEPVTCQLTDDQSEVLDVLLRLEIWIWLEVDVALHAAGLAKDHLIRNAAIIGRQLRVFVDVNFKPTNITINPFAC